MSKRKRSNSDNCLREFNSIDSFFYTFHHDIKIKNQLGALLENKNTKTSDIKNIMKNITNSDIKNIKTDINKLKNIYEDIIKIKNININIISFINFLQKFDLDLLPKEPKIPLTYIVSDIKGNRIGFSIYSLIEYIFKLFLLKNKIYYTFISKQTYFENTLKNEMTYFENVLDNIYIRFIDNPLKTNTKDILSNNIILNKENKYDFGIDFNNKRDCDDQEYQEKSYEGCAVVGFFKLNMMKEEFYSLYQGFGKDRIVMVLDYDDDYNLKTLSQKGVNFRKIRDFIWKIPENDNQRFFGKTSNNGEYILYFDKNKPDKTLILKVTLYDINTFINKFCKQFINRMLYIFNKTISDKEYSLNKFLKKINNIIKKSCVSESSSSESSSSESSSSESSSSESSSNESSSSESSSSESSSSESED
jgi:hypothetical protein